MSSRHDWVWVLLGMALVIAYALVTTECERTTSYEGSVYQEVAEATREIGD